MIVEIRSFHPNVFYIRIWQLFIKKQDKTTKSTFKKRFINDFNPWWIWIYFLEI